MRYESDFYGGLTQFHDAMKRKRLIFFRYVENNQNCVHMEIGSRAARRWFNRHAILRIP